MPDPLRSPKQSRVAAKSKSHPYARPATLQRARDVGLTRKSSLLGTIKDFVTAPLAWLSLGESQASHDAGSKRRVEGSERGGTPPKAKRARRDSPDGVVGYLDPPDSLFPSSKAPMPLSNNSNIIRTATAIDSSETYRPPPSVSRGHSILSQASMSVEPQESSPFRRSSTRDYSLPPPSPFARSYSRSSLTPQPIGATFGPSPKRKPRESTAPPLLGSSPTPSFTRPPAPVEEQRNLFPKAPLRHRSEGPLSSLLNSDRKSISPGRDTPTMLINDQNLTSRLPNRSATERTLSTLESFRTPLHVARFPSTPLAEQHRPRKVHVPLPSKLRFDHTPEGKKDKTKHTPTSIAPYSPGMSGMRKLLARRREELESSRAVEAETQVEAELERLPRLSPTEVDMENEGPKKCNDKSKAKVIQTESESDLPESLKPHPLVNGVATKSATSRSKPEGPYSMFRAPTSRVSRIHAPAPQLKKPRNKYSLDDEDDEHERMSVEEVKSYQSQTARAQSSITFSPVRRMSEAAMQTDMESSPRATSPPLPAQPQTFDSLLSRIGPLASTSTKSNAEFPPVPAQAKSPGEVPLVLTTEQPKADTSIVPKPDSESTPKLDIQDATPKADVSCQPQPAETSSAPATLPFSFNTPTPTPKPMEAASSPFAPASSTTILPSPSMLPTSGSGGVPSFFANTKAQFTPPKVPTDSLFTSAEKKDNVEQPKNEPFNQVQEKQLEKEIQQEAKASPFENANKSSPFGNGPPFGNNVISTSTSTTSSFSGFGGASPNEASKPASSFAAPQANGSDASKSALNIFGAAGKSDANPPMPLTAPSSGPPFAFGALATTKPDSNSAPLTPGTTSKPTFSFVSSATAAHGPETPKSLFNFGTTPSSQPTAPASEASKSPFSFGAAPSTPPLADKKPAFAFGSASSTGTSGFSFGSTTPSNGTSTGLDAPKPLFDGFGGGSTMATATPKTPEPPTEGHDRMETNGDRMEESPTRTVDKKDTQPTSFTGFGSGGTGFSFGQDKPAASPAFSFSQPKPAASTGFTFTQPSDKPASTNSTSTAFTFGSDTSKPSQSPFGAPTSNPFGSTSSSSTSSPSFTFGQPSSNPTNNATPFGQNQNGTGSAPGSPSLFPQTTTPQPQTPSFSFNTGSSSAFSSSNTGASVTSSPSNQPFQFGTPSNTPQPDAAGGSNMFTLGGAATPRKVKGLPNRRAKR